MMTTKSVEEESLSSIAQEPLDVTISSRSQLDENYDGKTDLKSGLKRLMTRLRSDFSDV